MNIPDEAVEAALRAQLSFKNKRGMDNNANLMRHILEAAAPHLMASALSSAAQAMELMPPMVRAHYVETLRLYASEPWRLETCPSECAAKHPGKEHAV